MLCGAAQLERARRFLLRLETVSTPPRPPGPPGSKPPVPKKPALAGLDGVPAVEDEEEAAEELEAELAEDEGPPLAAKPAPGGFGTEVSWDDGELGGGSAAPSHAAPSTASSSPMFAVGLANLDGTTDDVPAAPEPTSGPDQFGPPLDFTAPVSSTPVDAAQSTPGPAPPPQRGSGEDQFRAPSYEDKPIELNMTLAQAVAEKKEAPPEKELPASFEVAAPDPGAFIPIPGRFMEGRLRQNATLHIAIGLAIALGVGYLIARPVWRRSEMRIEFLQQEAARERARGLEEANEAAARIDKKIEDESTRSFIVVALLWAGIGGGLFALYYRFT